MTFCVRCCDDTPSDAVGAGHPLLDGRKHFALAIKRWRSKCENQHRISAISEPRPDKDLLVNLRAIFIPFKQTQIVGFWQNLPLKRPGGSDN